MSSARTRQRKRAREREEAEERKMKRATLALVPPAAAAVIVPPAPPISVYPIDHEDCCYCDKMRMLVAAYRMGTRALWPREAVLEAQAPAGVNGPASDVLERQKNSYLAYIFYKTVKLHVARHGRVANKPQVDDLARNHAVLEQLAAVAVPSANVL